MAFNENERMTTRQKRPNYFLLNDGLDDEALPEDCILESFQPNPDSFTNIGTSSSSILPSESVSQTLTGIISAESCSFPTPNYSRKRPRPAPVTSWIWDQFEVTEVEREWIVKKTKKRVPTDRDIRCAYLDGKTGLQCPWSTSDSSRQTSTTNMQRHLEKHSIFSPHLSQSEASGRKEQPSITSFIFKQDALSHQQRLEKNLLRWIVCDKQAFTTVESPEFRQIFQDIPGITLPFSSRSTLRRRLKREAVDICRCST